ncbi:unnamed protein product [Cochlearia groenlandica]
MFSTTSKPMIRLVLVPILVLMATQLVFIRTVSSLINNTNTYISHKCDTKQGKYKPGSKYEETRNNSIYGLALGDFRGGFEFSATNYDDNGLNSIVFQCRGDSYGPKCRDCYAAAVYGIRRRCPNDKGSIIWYDRCFLELSSVETHSKVNFDNSFCMSNPKKLHGDINLFHTAWSSLLKNLTNKALRNKGGFYAGGEGMFGKKKIYGMAQCVGDVPSATACKVCIERVSKKFENCWRDKEGGRFYGRSCSFRFEFYPFLNTTAPAPTPAPARPNEQLNV